MIHLLLAAAALAGGTPVERMVETCEATLESPAGKRALDYETPDLLTLGWTAYKAELDRRENSYQADLILRAHSAGLDLAQTRSVCDAMRIRYFDGVRRQLSTQRVVLESH